MIDVVVDFYFLRSRLTEDAPVPCKRCTKTIPVAEWQSVEHLASDYGVDPVELERAVRLAEVRNTLS